MIVKFLSRHSPSYLGLIDYILKEGKGGEHKAPEPYLHNFRGKSKTEWVKELCQNEAFRKHPRKDQVYFYHAMLSFSNLDSEKITQDILKDITTKFIDLRGKEGMFLTAQHQDREHLHIHCLISALEFKTGKAFRMTKNQFQDLKIELQNYQLQKFPQLENSLPNHQSGKEYLTSKEFNAKNKNTKAFQKAEITTKINDLLAISENQQQFLERLRENGLHHYERGGRAYGISLEDKNYRFSTLGIDLEKINSLPEDLTQEVTVLEEINQLRQEMELPNELEIENDIPEGNDSVELNV